MQEQQVICNGKIYGRISFSTDRYERNADTDKLQLGL